MNVLLFGQIGVLRVVALAALALELLKAQFLRAWALVHLSRGYRTPGAAPLGPLDRVATFSRA